MKVKLKIPMGKDQYTEIEATGDPSEIAEFLKMWLMGALAKVKQENPLAA